MSQFMPLKSFITEMLWSWHRITILWSFLIVFDNVHMLYLDYPCDPFKISYIIMIVYDQFESLLELILLRPWLWDWPISYISVNLQLFHRTLHCLSSRLGFHKKAHYCQVKFHSIIHVAYHSRVINYTCFIDENENLMFLGVDNFIDLK